MLQKKDLLEKFRDHLYLHYPNKKELVSVLADILNMESVSISRRLNGKIQFTVREMGIVADKLNISIDNLIKEKTDSDSILLSVKLLMPSSSESLESLVKEIETSKNKLKKMLEDPLRAGYIFDSLPVEFFAPYQHLCKFFYYKWAYYFTDENIHMDYSNWLIPDSIKELQAELVSCQHNFQSIFYIWDNPLIINLIREIDVFAKMRIIKDEDILLIKEDLHHMLNDVEMNIANEGSREKNGGPSIELYISNIKIGVSCICYDSQDYSFVNYGLPFAQASLQEDVYAYNKVYQWINSIKKISTLISGSGAINRRIFFDEQHKIIDNS